ncbi:hypothetical protein PsorP6_004356 [Peronosclerospora sorghi]|uniref:Uncharacterized protein n=1 Tax=Peronosclerospora sorghi TaxID=230839 RepID=A0ACC0VQ52_9STRA|nr:hypothetical protein PsorP6_004356 [Peronosclerospora sorghi]
MEFVIPDAGIEVEAVKPEDVAIGLSASGGKNMLELDEKPIGIGGSGNMVGASGAVIFGMATQVDDAGVCSMDIDVDSPIVNVCGDMYIGAGADVGGADTCKSRVPEFSSAGFVDASMGIDAVSAALKVLLVFS